MYIYYIKKSCTKINTENPQHFYSSSYFLFYLDVAIENIDFIIIIYSFSRRFYPKRLTNEDNRINQL